MIAAVSLFAGGCEKEPPTKEETRAVTAEIVDAAQRVTDHKSEITIRPGARVLRLDSSGPIAPDNVYLRMGEPSRISSLRHAFDGIAHRHKLFVSSTSSAGGVRFEFAADATITQIVHVVTPLSSRVNAAPRRNSQPPELAIILDDVGYDRTAADALLSLPFTFTLSVLPHLPLSSEVAEEAYRRGDEVMLHLPMQSNAGAPESVELRVGMNAAQVNSALSAMLETVPHAAGVNNHEGSLATSDPALMDALMPALRQRGLFFIDSRTTAATVAYDAAKTGVCMLHPEKCFLTMLFTPGAIRAQLNSLVRTHIHDGSAIAIGHPHPETIAALAEYRPGLSNRGGFVWSSPLSSSIKAAFSPVSPYRHSYRSKSVLAIHFAAISGASLSIPALPHLILRGTEGDYVSLDRNNILHGCRNVGFQGMPEASSRRPS